MTNTRAQMQELREFAQEHGGGKLVASAAIIHEFLGFSLFFGLWSICYATQPILTLKHTRWGKTTTSVINKKFPKFHQRVVHLYEKRPRKLPRIMKRLPLDPSRALISLGEQVVLRRFLSPVFIPLKIWITKDILMWMYRRNKPVDND
eukprot:137679_1